MYIHRQTQVRSRHTGFIIGITMIVAFTLTAPVRMTAADIVTKVWRPVGQVASPTPPQKSVLFSTLDSTVFEIDIAGLLAEEMVTDQGTFQLVEIPGETWSAVEGKPMVPEMIIRVACPEFDDVHVDYVAEATHVFHDYDLLPCPCGPQGYGPGAPYSHREFCIDEDAYGADVSYPSRLVDLLRIGRIRDQKVVWLGVYPVQYNAAKRSLAVHGRLRISLHYTNPAPTLAAMGTGPFDGACQRQLLGYSEMHQVGPITLLRSGGGRVKWAANLDSCIANDTDYLIVTADAFWTGRARVPIDSLAYYRARSSGLNVSIVNVNDIVGNPGSADADSLLKQFIQDLYEDGNAGHWWDGHLGFVLLVGDYASPDDSLLMPIHVVLSQYGGPDYPDSNAADSWYAAVGGDPVYPAVMLGRISVDDTTELWTVVNKIKDYEPLPDTDGWSREVLLTAGTAHPHEDYEPGELEAVAEAFGDIESLLDSNGYDVTRLRGDSLCCVNCENPNCPDDLEEMNAAEINEGKLFVHYLIHGNSCEMGYHDPRSFTYCGIDTLLTNEDSLCIFTAMSTCMVARFDREQNVNELCAGCASEKYDCIGEKLLHMSSGGAVAVIGNTAGASDAQIGDTDLDFYESVAESKVPLLGEAFVEMVLQMNPYYPSWVERCVILGDPALRLRYRESGYQKWDMWVRPDTNSIWFDPPIDATGTPDSTTLRAVIRNAAGTALNIPDSQSALAVGFWTSLTPDSLKFLGADSLRFVGAWDSVIVGISFPVSDSLAIGIHDFKIEIDPEASYADSEAHRDNNEAVIEEYVGLPPSKGVLPAELSDCPTLAYLETGPSSSEHLVLFPCENSHLYVFRNTGSRYSWSFNANDGPLYAPAVYTDQNGKTWEIVASEHKLWCVDVFESGSSEQVEWERDLGDTTIMTPPCVTDLDGDGDLEVVVAVANVSADTGYVLRINGDNSSNFGDRTCLGDSLPSCPLATFDLDGDGAYDILAGTNSSGLVAIDGPTGTKVATVRAGKKYFTVPPEPVSAIVVGDLDLNGTSEIVTSAGRFVAVFPADTTLSPSTKKNAYVTPITGLAIADMLDNPDTLALEIVTSGPVASSADVKVSIFNYVSGPSIVKQRETVCSDTYESVSRPVIANLHHEPRTEALFFTTDTDRVSAMWIWNADSDKIVGFSDNIKGPVTAAITCDFDDDFVPEIMFADTVGSVWLVKGGLCSRRVDWPMAFGDERCRNIYAVPLADTLPAGNNRLWGRYLAREDVWLTTGSTLTVDAGTRIEFLPSDSYPPRLICFGNILAQGRGDAPIVFTSADPTPRPGDWGHLWLRSGIDGSLEHTVVEYGTDGLHIALPTESPLCGEGGSITVRSCEFRYNETWGIEADNTAAPDTVRIEDCLFKNNSVGGIRLPYGFADIRGCKFVKDSVSYGGASIYAMKLGGGSGGNTCFAGCNIADNCMEIGEDTDPDTHYWDYGIVIFTGDGGDSIIVKGNSIFPCHQGAIWIDSLGSPANIYNNCVGPGEQEYKGFGMKFTSGGTDTAIVHDNIFLRNMYGVIATSDPFPILGDSLKTVFIPPDTTRELGYNRLWDNLYYIKSDPSRTLKAEMCWWGEQVYPGGFDGDVDYKPYLDDEPAGVPDAGPDAKGPVYTLTQNRPNPLFTGNARIRFSVAEECVAEVAVYNVLGQQVRVLHSGKTEAGWHEISWDATNQGGRRVSAGVYFYRLETPGYRATKKIVVLQ